MPAVVLTGIIAAAAAVLGGLLAAFATRSVERLRLRAALQEKASERRLASIEEFMLAANGWLDWLMFMEEAGWDGLLDEYNSRVKRRDDAYRRLLLLASDGLYSWLSGVYAPLEYELKGSYARQVRHGAPVSAEAREIRRRFSKLLREDLVERARPEVVVLREPVKPRGPSR